MVDLGNREPGFNPHINYECKTTKNWSIKNIDLKELVSKIRSPGQHITLTLKNTKDTKQYRRRIMEIENKAKEDERRKQRIRQRL
jgi:carbamoylphosphate synthase small subunit